MSRTKRGTKPPGFEYWTARPHNKHGCSALGKEGKKRTHKAERQQGKQEAKGE